jgi:hypothetical protein
MFFRSDLRASAPLREQTTQGEEAHMEGTLHKLKSVADRFQVSTATVNEWIRLGHLEAVRLSSGKFRVTEAAMQKLLHPVQKRKAK